MQQLKPIALVLALATLAGCANDPNRNTKIGVGAGAVLGGVIGRQVSGADGAPIVGAVVGAIAGGAVGNYMDRQRRELEAKLAEEARRKDLVITQIAPDTLKIGVASDVSFDTGSAQLSGNAQATFAKIASTLTSYDKTVIHVVGHTDTVGSTAFNQNLSNQRAAAVGSYMASQGLPANRIREEGRGERELLIRTADNVAEPRNRRVDIVIKAVVEGNEQAAWTPPPYLGG